MNVLSLFDGISCGQVALKRAGIPVDNYFASEIDKHAIKVTQNNYPNTIQLGDVEKWREWDLPKIDLILAGSPCQGFSFAGKQLNFEDPRSKLFFTFVDILNYYNPTHFLLENVRMKKESQNVISERVGAAPVAINSRLVSAQNRPRLYWSNLPITQPEDRVIYLKDILEDVVDEKYFIKAGRLNWLNNYGQVKEKGGYIAFNPPKAKCLTVRAEPSWNCTYLIPQRKAVGQLVDGDTRKLTPIECERLQTLPDNYTNCISDTQRYKALGNGWTVEVITHILKGISTPC